MRQCNVQYACRTNSLCQKYYINNTSSENIFITNVNTLRNLFSKTVSKKCLTRAQVYNTVAAASYHGCILGCNQGVLLLYTNNLTIHLKYS